MTPVRKLLVALALVVATAAGGSALAGGELEAIDLPNEAANPPSVPIPDTGDRICVFAGHDDVEVRQCVPLP